MRKATIILSVAMLTVISFATVSFQSCTKDKCENVHCSNGGTCNDGKCSCRTGYEGTYCQNKINEKFQGTYIGTDCSEPASWTLQAMGEPQTVWLSISGLAVTIPGSITGNNITFPAKTFSVTGNSYTFNGNGTLSGNSLTVTYHMIDNTNVDAWNCSFTGTK